MTASKGRGQIEQRLGSVGKPTWAPAATGMARFQKAQGSRLKPETGMSTRQRPNTVVGRGELFTRGMPAMPAFETAQFAARRAKATNLLTDTGQVYVHDRCSYDTFLSSYGPASLNNTTHASTERSLPALPKAPTPATKRHDGGGAWAGAPEGWDERMDGRGRIYYVNMIDKTISWTHPTQGKMEQILRAGLNSRQAAERMARAERDARERSPGSPVGGTSVTGSPGRGAGSGAGSPPRGEASDITQVGFRPILVNSPGRDESRQGSPTDGTKHRRRGSIRWEDDKKAQYGGKKSPPVGAGGGWGGSHKHASDGLDAYRVPSARPPVNGPTNGAHHARSSSATPSLEPIDPYRRPSTQVAGRFGGPGGNGDPLAATLASTSMDSISSVGSKSKGMRVHQQLAKSLRLNCPDVSLIVKGFPRNVAVVTPYGVLDNNDEMLPSSSPIGEGDGSGSLSWEMSEGGDVAEELRLRLREWLLSPMVQRWQVGTKTVLKLPPELKSMGFTDAIEELRASLDAGQISVDLFRYLKATLFSNTGPLRTAPSLMARTPSPPRRMPPKPIVPEPWGKEPVRRASEFDDEWEDEVDLGTTYRTEHRSPSGRPTDHIPVAGMSHQNGTQVPFPGTRNNTARPRTTFAKPDHPNVSKGVTAIFYDSAHADDAARVPTNSTYGLESDRYAPERWYRPDTVLRDGETPDMYIKVPPKSQH